MTDQLTEKTAWQVQQETTANAIAGMLTQQTGSVLTDSGGAYGYAWQHNKTRDLQAEPAAHYKVDKWGGLNFYKSLFHYLCERLNFVTDVNVLFDAYAETQDRNVPWETVMESFTEIHAAWYTMENYDTDTLSDVLAYMESTNIDEYMDTLEVKSGFYTYNYDNVLDQDFVCIEYEIDGDPFVFIRIHNGCDARWGFTDPIIFELSDDYDLYDFNNCEIVGGDYYEGTLWRIKNQGSNYWSINDRSADDWNLIPYTELKEKYTDAICATGLQAVLTRLANEYTFVWADEMYRFVSEGQIIHPHDLTAMEAY